MAIDRSQVTSAARSAASTFGTYANKAADKVGPAAQSGASKAATFASSKVDNPTAKSVIREIESGFERPTTQAGRATSGVNAGLFGTAAATSLIYIPIVSSLVNGASVAVAGAVEYGMGMATKNNGLKQAGSLAMTTAVTATIAGLVPFGDTAVYSGAALIALKNSR